MIDNNLKRRMFHSFIVVFIINMCLITFLNCYNYTSAAIQTEEDGIQMLGKEFLTWIEDSTEIEGDNKIRVLNFFKIIRKNADGNKASFIIHSLAGNYYYDNKDNNLNSYRLSFLDTMPNNTPIKTRILSDLNKIADLAKVGDTKGIVSLIDGRMTTLQKYYSYLTKKEQVTSIPLIFPVDRKDSLIKFFRRMDNDITKNALHYLFDIYEAINNNDIIEADNILNNNRNYNSIYSLKSSILNLEDFGAGYRSFSIWSNELNSLLETFNLKDNKPRINELLSYIIEANVSYFKHRAPMAVPNYTSGIDIVSELIDGKAYTIQKEGVICVNIATIQGGLRFIRLLINNITVSTLGVNSPIVPMISGEFMVKTGDLIKVETDQLTNLNIELAKFFPFN